MSQKLTLIFLITTLIAVGCTEGPQAIEGTITLEDPQSPFVSFNIWLKIGSQNDPSGKQGLAALTAALLESGSTTSNSYEQVLEKLYPMASGYSASVDKEMTTFTGRVHIDNLDSFYSLFKEALLLPAFDQNDFNRVKTQTMNYLRQLRRYSSDEELGKELLFREILRGTPYEHPEEGYVSSVDSITLDDVKSFYRSHYLRGNVVVGLAGNYPIEFPRKVRDDFNSLPEGETPEVGFPMPAPIRGINVLIVDKPTQATAISIGYPIALLRNAPDFPAMMLMNSWFGEHRKSSSHLYQVIRETRGMNYGDYSYIEAYPMGHIRSLPPTNVSRRQQIFQIWIRPVSMREPGDLHDRGLFATRAALRELSRLVENGLPAEALDVTKGFLNSYTVNYGATLGDRLGYRIDDQFYGISDPGFLAGIRPALAGLSLEEVNTAIRKHLQDKDMWIVFITANAEEFKRKLLSGEATPIEYAGEKPEEVLEEDREISTFPIPVSEDRIQIIGIDEVFEN